MSAVTSVTLGEVADLLVGNAFKSDGFLNEDEHGIPILRGENVGQGSLKWFGKTKRWHEDDLPELGRYELRLDDVILAMDRPIVGDGLKYAWITEADLPCLLVQRVCRIRGNAEIALTDYLRFVIASPAFTEHIHRITTGANIPHISGKDISAFSFPLPSLAEQEKIVEALAPYDELVKNHEKQISLLEEAARLIYTEWFVRLRFPGHEKAKTSGSLPDNWCQEALGQRIELNYGKSLKESDRHPGEIPVFGSSGIVGSHSVALSHGPGIIVGRKGNVGSIFYSAVPFFAIDTVYFISPEQTTFFLLHTLQRMNFISSDAAVPGLNRNYAYSQLVIWPSDSVLSKFEATCTPIYEQITTLKKQIAALKSARDLLLPRLISGQLRL